MQLLRQKQLLNQLGYLRDRLRYLLRLGHPKQHPLGQIHNNLQNQNQVSL